MNQGLTTDITVKELLDRRPKLIQAFMDLGLLCVGCPAEAFHTIINVANEYGCDPNELLEHFERFSNATEISKILKP